MSRILLPALMLSISLSAFAGGRGAGPKTKSAEEIKKAQMEELKQNIKKYYEEDALQRQLYKSSYQGKGVLESPSNAQGSVAEPSQGKSSEPAGKAALCGTYEQSESCQSVSQPGSDDMDADKENDSGDSEE